MKVAYQFIWAISWPFFWGKWDWMLNLLEDQDD